MCKPDTAERAAALVTGRECSVFKGTTFCVRLLIFYELFKLLPTGKKVVIQVVVGNKFKFL